MTLLEFANKYKSLGCPINPELMGRVLVTDVSTSTLIWSEDDFLVELYLMHPHATVVKHSHPFENIILFVNGSLAGSREGSEMLAPCNNIFTIGSPLEPNKWHQFVVGSKGATFYNISKWSNTEDKDSAILKYCGEPLGPIHKALLDSNL